MSERIYGERQVMTWLWSCQTTRGCTLTNQRSDGDSEFKAIGYVHDMIQPGSGCKAYWIKEGGRAIDDLIYTYLGTYFLSDFLKCFMIPRQ